MLSLAILEIQRRADPANVNLQELQGLTRRV